MKPGEQKVLEDIGQYGWHCIKVLPDVDHEPHSYSIGLFETWGHPEIVITGLKGETSHALINVIASDVSDGKSFDAGQVYENVTASGEVAFVEVSPHIYSDYLGFALWYYGGKPFPVLQMVWPDRNGYFPWQPGYDSSLAGVQAVLGATT